MVRGADKRECEIDGARNATAKGGVRSACESLTHAAGALQRGESLATSTRASE